MADPLSMSLEDIIKTNKKPGSAKPRGGARTRPSGPGPARRLPNRAANRAAPYAAAPYAAALPRAPETTWQHDMFADQVSAFGAAQPGRASAIETGTKLYISNLDYGVSNEDVKELFSEVGDLKRFTIHYDRSGRSKGTAEVVFSRRADAMAAVKRYNNVQLDGKPMKIEIVGTNIVTPAPPPLPINGAFGNPYILPRGGQGRGGAQGHGQGQGQGQGQGRPRGGGGGGGRGPRRGGRGGRGRGGGGGGGRGEKLSSDDLDADLEKYHAEAMQEN